MDCFYAQVEVKHNPNLRGKPVGVGGRAEGRGVLTTASYEARKFGVKSAMPVSHAVRLCPELILVPPHFALYKAESQKIREIFHRYTDKVEPLSLDEAYLDVSHVENATETAKEIRARILDVTGLTSSAGIAPNKFLAKVGSDWRKPNGQFTVYPKIIDEFVRHLKIEKVPGIGKVTSKKMNGMGIFSCADLQKFTIEELTARFGSWGMRLYDLSRGVDNREVSSGGERKSLSVESTYGKDLKDVEGCVDKVPKLYEEFQKRLARANVEEKIQSLVVKVKFCDFKQTTFERSDIKTPDLEIYKSMIREAYLRGDRPVRLLGLGVKLAAKKSRPRTPQMALFDEQD